MPETSTFLFTDIERSTETVAALGDERYADMQDVHHKLLREAFGAHGGREVGTEGDAFFVAFADAPEAVAAAIDGQRALERHDWPDNVRLRVRMGMHTGVAIVRGGDYIGHDVHRAKRICDAGHGGQVLLSDATAQLVEARVSLVDLGLHRLKDLTEPQRIFQVDDPRVARSFPALRSLDAFTHNLPTQRSTFIGRQTEVDRIREALGTNRLVTLTGVGGCGKTRLALQVAADELNRFTNGVFFIDLAPITDPSQVTHTVAAAIDVSPSGLGESSAVPLDRKIIEHLERRSCLLLFDNCEHLLDESAETIDRLLTGCPNVTVLATSREQLGLDGERAWRVPSLSVPAEGDEAFASEAVSLFVSRAQAADPSFELTPDNAQAVVEICRRLDGIPLAVEFAAARVSHLSPRQIADRLDSMFELLTGGRRRVQRQQTLQAALDWSYELLTEAEQLLLQRLAVFAGSFGLAAAEGVCAAGVIERRQVLDLMGSLVVKSLVVAEHADDETRYRLLETVRLYAEELLRASGDADTIRDRHRDHYDEWIGSLSIEDVWLNVDTYETFRQEIGNLRAALRWARTGGHRDLVARVLARLGPYWGNTGSWDEALEWTAYVLEDPDGVANGDVVEALSLRAFLGMWQSDGSGPDYARRAIELADGAPSPGLLMAMIMLSFNIAVVASVMRSEELADEARRLSDDAILMGEKTTLHLTGDTLLLEEGLAWVYSYRAMAETTLRDFDAAARYFEMTIEARRSAVSTLSRDPILAAAAHGALAAVRHLNGEDDAAIAAADVAAVLMRDADGFAWNSVQLQGPRIGLAVAYAAAGRLAEARAEARLQLIGARDSGVILMVNDALITSGVVAFLTGDPRTAYALLVAAPNAGGAKDLSTPFRSPTGYALWDRYRPLAKAAIDPDEATELRARGLAMTLDEAADLALAALTPDRDQTS